MRVVVVEDNIANARLLATLLTLDGFAVRSVTTDFEELAANPSRWVDVDAAVVDLMLPGICGEDIIATIPEHVRVVVLTAARTDTLRPATRARAYAVLAKPSDIDAVVAALGE